MVDRDTVAEMQAWAGIETGMPHAKTGAVVELPDFREDAAGRFVFTWKDDGLRVVVEDLYRTTRDFNGYVTAVHRNPETGKTGILLSRTRLNLVSVSARQGVARLLQARMDRNWIARIEIVSSLCDDNYVEGEPPVFLSDVVDPGEANWLVYPILERDKHTIIFADGGSTKSLLALALASSVADGTNLIPGTDVRGGGNVLYLDWEADKETLKRRYSGLAGGVGQVIYKRMYSSLIQGREDLSKLIKEYGIDLVIYDSVSMACGGQISDEQAVTEFFLAHRSFGITGLSIAHVPKNVDGIHKPIGTTFWHNQARATWEIIKQQEANEGHVEIGLYNRKNNDNMLFKPMGYKVDFTNGIKYMHTDVTSNVVLQKNQSYREKVRNYLVKYPEKTAGEIAIALGAAVADITATLQAGKGTVFTEIGLTPPLRWGVLTPDNMIRF